MYEDCSTQLMLLPTAHSSGCDRAILMQLFTTNMQADSISATVSLGTKSCLASPAESVLRHAPPKANHPILNRVSQTDGMNRPA